MNINKNIGASDRIWRLILSNLMLIILFFADSLTAKFVLGIASLFTLYEGLVGWCAFYALIGKNTCPIKLK